MSLTSSVQSLLRGVRRSHVLLSSTSVRQQHQQRQRKVVPVSPSVLESQSKLSSSPLFKPEVVIFDKDGTLVCFHTMWNSWCEQLASRMNKETDTEVNEELFSMLGYDEESKRVRMGMLAEKTHPYIKEKVIEMLETHHQFSKWEATRVMEKTWKDTPENLQIKMTGNLASIFKKLKDEGIKIAICTSDSREGTEEFLTKLSLTQFVDMVLCGDDTDSISKPNPHNALHICSKLGVAPSKAIMVGDTPADTIMGQAAHLGLTVGVLTGVGDTADLRDADLIVSNVDDVLDLVCPDLDQEDNVNTVITNRGLAKIVRQGSFN